ncbi:hypothetical protein [Bacteroides sp.]|uniref:hypothetical protein n=1 Tax=Bacteroides sp. TaxID=29523 RepID=UPI0025BAE893|nr:hypothetical protein [Bacteroides sp.]
MKRIRENHKKWAHHKKELHRRRKNKRKKTFVSRIIADTNIWLHILKDNDELLESTKKYLCPNYINLWELCNSGRLISHPNNIREAFIKLMPLINKGLFEQPLRYLIRMANRKCVKKKRVTYELLPKTNDMLTMAKRIINGAYISEKHKENFHNYITQEKKGLEDLKNSFREMSKQCQKVIKNKKKHMNRLSIEQIYDYLNFYAQKATNGRNNLHKLPRRNYELLTKTMDYFYKKLETGSLVWSRDDLYDLFILAYVRRGDKYWTKDQKWIDLIKEAGCEEYLFNPDVK